MSCRGVVVRRTQVIVPCRRGRHRVHLSKTQRLAQPFVVAKKEGLVLLDRPSVRGPELVAAERRNYGSVKVVSRIERTIPKELVRVAVEPVGPGARDGAD